MIIVIAILSGLLAAVAVGFFFYVRFERRFANTLQATHEQHISLVQTQGKEAHELMKAILDRWLVVNDSATLEDTADGRPRSPSEPEADYDGMSLADLEKQLERETHNTGASKGPVARRTELALAVARKRSVADRVSGPAPAAASLDAPGDDEDLEAADLSHLSSIPDTPEIRSN